MKHSGGNTLIQIERERIRPFADQPRKYFDPSAVADLARSLKSAGQQVPIVVRPLAGDPRHDFELVDGQRRWHAAGLAHIPALTAWVRTDLGSPDDQFLASVVANFSREGHSAPEIAHAIARLRKRKDIAALPKAEQAERIGELFGRSNVWVYMYEKLLRLDPKVLALMQPSVPEPNRLKAWIAMLLVDFPAGDQIRIATSISKGRLGFNAAKRHIQTEASMAGVRIGTQRNQPSRQFNRIATSLTQLAEAGAALIEIPLPQFRVVLNSRPPAERESIFFRLGAAAEHIEKLVRVARDVVRNSPAHGGVTP